MKNKKIIALLLIAALVLGGAVGVSAELVPTPNNLLNDLITYYGAHAENYCECCFYEQELDSQMLGRLNDASAEMNLDLEFTEGMTLGEGIGMLMDFTPDDDFPSQKYFLVIALFDNPFDLESHLGTTEPDEVDNLELATFIIVKLNDGEYPFADCGAGCETCAAGECDCCGCGSILDVFEFIRLLAAKLFAIFNYMNTREVVTLD